MSVIQMTNIPKRLGDLMEVSVLVPTLVSAECGESIPIVGEVGTAMLGGDFMGSFWVIASKLFCTSRSPPSPVLVLADIL